ncbi:MAG: signal recognition particle-docking protein FtsY [Clostridia bacterium]|nr:signal recognition particle-docking protein FtsY [Clostridia bacterium]
MGLFDKLKKGLKKTKDSIFSGIGSVLKSFTRIDEELMEELEEILITSDLGMPATEHIMGELRAKIKSEGLKDPADVTGALRQIMTEMMEDEHIALKTDTKPSVILVIGVNGVGKTTSIGKIAAMFTSQGKKVVVGAADTFRAAAVSQLEIWAERAGAAIVKRAEGSDPASVVFDTLAYAKANNCDIVICDTAGRLHNKKNLMDELEKMSRIIERECPGCDRENLLVIDATTGQNALIQAREFSKVTHLTGIVLTKLDGSAKGGIVCAVKLETGVPVKFVGVGEQIDDLMPFDPEMFAKALIEE